MIELKEIEEKTGINLDIFAKAMNNGIYNKNKISLEIIYIKPENILGLDFIFSAINTLNNRILYFSDYGKTWALTKKELKE